MKKYLLGTVAGFFLVILGLAFSGLLGVGIVPNIFRFAELHEAPHIDAHTRVPFNFSGIILRKKYTNNYTVRRDNYVIHVSAYPAEHHFRFRFAVEGKVQPYYVKFPPNNRDQFGPGYCATTRSYEDKKITIDYVIQPTCLRGLEKGRVRLEITSESGDRYVEDIIYKGKVAGVFFYIDAI